MEELLKVLKDAGVEITEEMKSKIGNVYPDTEGLFTQNELDEIVKKRVSREQKVYENQIQDLENKLEGMVDPDKIEEYKSEINNLKEERDKIRNNLVTDYELKLASKNAGVEDVDYFDYLVEKNNLKSRLKLDEEGNVVATDAEGNILTEEGKKLGPEALVNEVKEMKPSIFGEAGEEKKEIGSPTNPKSKKVDKSARTKEVAEELGYRNKTEKE